MLSKIAVHSGIVSLEVLLPDRFNVSRILFFPAESAKSINFDYVWTTPEGGLGCDLFSRVGACGRRPSESADPGASASWVLLKKRYRVK